MMYVMCVRNEENLRSVEVCKRKLQRECDGGKKRKIQGLTGVL
jgi:hypothetical protein